MKKIGIIGGILLSLTSLKAQEFPKAIKVPVLSTNPNVQFTVLNYEMVSSNQFSILYYQPVYGSVLHAGEFVSDTGGVVFKDKKFNEPIVASNTALLVKKQIFDANSQLVDTKEYIFSTRALDQEGEFRLYFQKGFKHPVLDNRRVITQSIYNIQGITDFTASEMKAMVDVSRPFIPVAPGQVIDNNVQRESMTNSIANDIQSMKSQFKAMKQIGVMAKGNLPGDEKILTRNGVSDKRMFVITKTKGDNCLLKFYVSEDLKTYDLLDTIRINGDIQITSAAAVYNTNSEVVGAYNNFVYKYKNEAGVELSRQYTFVMDPDYSIQSWMYSVGKDKLGSVAPEICWYEGKELYVLSSNNEKIFKPYLQVHKFLPGTPPELLFPANDEEKGSTKTGFVKTYQPDPPIGTSGIAPVADKSIALKMIKAGTTRYVVMQDSRYDDVAKARRYMGLDIYRIEGSGKVTNVDLLSDYNQLTTFPMLPISKSGDSDYYLLAYPIRVQMVFSPEKCQIMPLTADNTMLIPLMDNSLISANTFGSIMLKRSLAGSDYTVLYYPKN